MEGKREGREREGTDMEKGMGIGKGR